ncbi:MAG TPA: DNA polymerase III subunit alpha [Candidatus Paceibacterota bacterium]
MARAHTFTHLHVHSHYSLLEALPKIEELVSAAKADGQTALALTDSGNMYGIIDFYQECKKQGIKPIIGSMLHVAPRTRHDKEHRADDMTSRVILLAKDDRGYHNLIRLVSLAHLEGFFNTPRVDRELLERYKDGLIVILAAYWGEHALHLRSGAEERAEEALQWYKKTFGDSCFIEITRHPEFKDHEPLMQKALVLGKRVGVSPIATHESYYLKKDDALARELVNKIRTGSTLNRDMETVSGDFSFISQARAHTLFKDMPEALANTERVADICTVDIPLGKWVFPEFPHEAGKSHEDMLRDLSYGGIKTRNLQNSNDIRGRIDYELSIINTKGYTTYFLVMADILREARARGILTNTRGSAAGSLVCYTCGITTVNPLMFNMPFERFLNPERPSPPDIDLDLADDRRDELIEYIRTTYGKDHVAQIGTFGSMLSRAAIRDVARALGHPYALGDRIAKLIPFPKQGFHMSIHKALEEVVDLSKLYKEDETAREVLDMAQKIEGNARHVGVHAAGIFITPKPIIEYVPIQRDPKSESDREGKIITQYDMYSAGEDGLGLLKFDLLGLKNLAVLADAIARVKERLGTAIHLDQLPLDDKKTFAMLSRGETLGVFQFAGSGMTTYLTELEPTSIHDLNAMVALYRPGPIAFIPHYIERKRNPSLVTYLDPRLEPILKNTYGILIYQDDLLLIAAELAGYTLGEADKFRRAVGKKIPEEMQAQKNRFLKGCVERGMAQTIAQKLWEQIETFAAYGFNKSHAASYGNLAYQTAYMKANYPVDYMAAVLTGDAGDVEKIAEIVSECTRMNIAVLPPSINESLGNFTVVDPDRDASRSNGAGELAIRFGLYSIKNFGRGVADSIIAARISGAFTDIADFVTRVEGKNINKKSLSALIQSGATDMLGERGILLSNIEAILQYHKECTRVPDQTSLFAKVSRAPLNLTDGEHATIDQRLAWEKELLGLYVSGHPLDKHAEKLARQKLSLKTLKETFPHGVETVIAGLLGSVQNILTKGGERMAFGKLEDRSGSVEIVIFPRTLKESEDLVKPGVCIMAKGKFSERNGEASFVVERIRAL